MMNDRELDLALERFVNEHKQAEPPTALYRRVGDIPTSASADRRRSAWMRPDRFAKIFRATGVLVGVGIVALAGGLLFSAAQPSPVPDVPAPTDTAAPSPRATVAASPSPTGAPSDATQAIVRGDLVPGVDLEVGEEGPGIYRVHGDGVRALSPIAHDWVASGRDGSIWLYSSDGATRLGTAASVERPILAPWFRVAPDGTVWIIGTEPDTERIVVSSFDGEAWTTHDLPGEQQENEFGWALDVAADGTVWAAWPDPTVGGYSRIARRSADGWTVLDEPAAITGLTVTDDGELWSPDDGLRHGPGVMEGYVDTSSDADEYFSVGREGTKWSIARDGQDLVGLARTSGGDWEPCPLDATPEAFRPALVLAVAPDGSLWGRYTARNEGALPSDGLARFDCQTWSYPLAGQNVPSSAQPVAIADDGSVWVVTVPERPFPGPAPDDAGQRRLYVITPEAFGGGDP